jgi:AcrR family transcriptional regulator
MESKKVDRRVRRSRRMFREAMRELIMEKSFEKITVKEITERAGLQRATFYLHYQTKEDLLRNVLAETFGTLVDQNRDIDATDTIGGRTHTDAYLEMFEHVAENAALYQQLVSGRGKALAYEQIREYLVDVVLTSLSAVDDNALELPREVMAQYIAGAELSLIVWWLNAGMPYTTQQMAEMSHRLVLRGVADVLSEPSS